MIWPQSIDFIWFVVLLTDTKVQSHTVNKVFSRYCLHWLPLKIISQYYQCINTYMRLLKIYRPGGGLIKVLVILIPFKLGLVLMQLHGTCTVWTSGVRRGGAGGMPPHLWSQSGKIGGNWEKMSENQGKMGVSRGKWELGHTNSEILRTLLVWTVDRV